MPGSGSGWRGKADTWVAYQISGLARIYAWLAAEKEPAMRDHVLAWLVPFAEDPLVEAERAPGHRAPVYAVLVPGTTVMVTFLLAAEFSTVVVREIVDIVQPGS